MALEIRQATETDAPALSRVCLLTADIGKPADALHDYPELPGIVYSVPYVKLPETWGFVLEDPAAKEVVGYIVGSTDTRIYEQHALTNWFPSHAARYPSPETNPHLKPADKRYIERLNNPDSLKALDADVAFSPAHMHINILEEYQRQGWGRKLVGAAVRHLKEKGLERVWLGIDPRNVAARTFYERIGFRPIEGAPDDSHLGLELSEFRE